MTLIYVEWYRLELCGLADYIINAQGILVNSNWHSSRRFSHKNQMLEKIRTSIPETHRAH
jgi:hypothetical protein